MFSGIVEAVGRVAALSPVAAGALRLSVETPWPQGALVPGESVAVDGVCLTVVAAPARMVSFDISSETAARTTLARRRVGDRVNLERALRLDGRIGGHLVLGHVDAVARVRWVRRSGPGLHAGFSLPEELAPLVALKGSVTLDGVSLTVAGLEDGGFWVALVPFTLAHTTLGEVRVGREVNLEVDVLARYVQRQLELAGIVSPRQTSGPGTDAVLTRTFLESTGFPTSGFRREGG